MDVKNLSLQDLESYFNLTQKIREGVIMMARANNNFNTSEVKFINKMYDIFFSEIMRRIKEVENYTLLN